MSQEEEESISHRFLEYAASDRSSCAKCGKPLAEGELRYGTKVHIKTPKPGHDSVTWRCLSCITHRQAENMRAVAAEKKETLHEYLTVPPADASGPPPEVVELFLRYMEALHKQDEDKMKSLLRELHTHRKARDRAEQKKKAGRGKKREPEVSVEDLDRQLREDPKMLKLFKVPDLRSLCQHHNIDATGTKPVLTVRLREFYGGEKPSKE